MNAAVVREPGRPPEFGQLDEPTPGEGEVVITVRAAALNPSARATASGTHYASRRDVPFVAGLDGAGTLDDGRRVFFGGPRAPFGSFAERTVVNAARCWDVPDGVDDATAAALPNPALSSWLPMVHQARLQPGETVLVLGATGTAGKLAIQVAKLLGAGRVVAAGRNRAVLATLGELGADATIQLDQPHDALVEAFRRDGGYDVVLDYVWGKPTEALLEALTRSDFEGGAGTTTIVQIGEGAGPAITLPAAALRSGGLTITGTGLPPFPLFLETFNRAMACAAEGTLRIETNPVPLAEVERAWAAGDRDGRRTVVVP